MTKVVGTDFGTTSKLIIMVFLALKTFDLVPESVPTTFGTRSKVFIMQNNAFKTFNLLPKFGTRSKDFKLIELVPVANF